MSLCFVLIVTGCVKNRAKSQYCPVLNYAGSLGEPYGLVKLEPTLESKLMKVLKEKGAKPFICWYTTGEEIIAGQKSGGILLGTVFVIEEGQWVLADEPDRILQFY